jgi:hypothetical protein
MSSRHRFARGSAAGNIITLLLLVGVIAMGAWLWLGKKDESKAGPSQSTSSPQGTSEERVAKPEGDAPSPIEPVTGTPTLEAANTFVPKDNILRIDISEYAGYGGLIVANGGLEPNAESFFAKEYGFKVAISMSESETWGPLNNGRLAATATTADALAVLGRQFEAVIPIQLGYSRGADMVVVDKGIASINALKGKTLAASQFNESEFFIRYLAQEAGVPVTVLRDLDSKPAAGSLGLVFYEDAFVACDAYQHELASGGGRLNGCVGWTPKTDEVIEASNGAAKALVSNRNLLVVADVLAVNKGFAKAQPEMVKGLVHGILEGNRRLRDNQAENIAVVATRGRRRGVRREPGPRAGDPRAVERVPATDRDASVDGPGARDEDLEPRGRRDLQRLRPHLPVPAPRMVERAGDAPEPAVRERGRVRPPLRGGADRAADAARARGQLAVPRRRRERAARHAPAPLLHELRARARDDRRRGPRAAGVLCRLPAAAGVDRRRAGRPRPRQDPDRQPVDQRAGRDRAL